MPDALFQLSPTPPDFQRFAWNGLPLLLPLNWNLQMYNGTVRQGALVFVDMEQVRLELRWKRAGSLWLQAGAAERLLEQTVRRLRNRAETHVHERNGFMEVRSADAVTVLVAHEGRLLELHWPNGAENVTLIAEDFVAALRAMNAQSERMWSVYGAAGMVPRRLALRVVSMLPGATRLEFRRGSRRMTLGSFSLADRLLGADTLRTWAARTIPLLKTNQHAEWTAGEATARATLRTRDILPWRNLHTVEFRHDASVNRIEWTHRAEPV